MDHEELDLCLRRRGMDGNDDEKVAVLDASEIGGRMWFYRDHAFIMAITDVSSTFDPETRESEKSVIRLFLVDLDSGETEILAESSLTEAINYAFQVYQIGDGKVYYYYLEEDNGTSMISTQKAWRCRKRSRPGQSMENTGNILICPGSTAMRFLRMNPGNGTLCG